ncbi:uncharacterized protein CEXT_812691 [Caerostris extrusa]|uniref:Uncharacterized protein n=1 Tax=Caerostris extrusa TaxID=172846 RepID=A0AAV4NGK7_CAEEX|nr:uncharacterized protein CEXT_812691 [Caerostris extrusa]
MSLLFFEDFFSFLQFWAFYGLRQNSSAIRVTRGVAFDDDHRPPWRWLIWCKIVGHQTCQRSVAVVDVNCAGRQAPLSDSNLKEAETSCPWILGFTESQDGNTSLVLVRVRALRRQNLHRIPKDPTCGKQEALIALMELDDAAEVAGLRNVLPELLKVEREGRESCSQFLRNSLVSCVRYLRGRGYSKDLGITLCHLSSVIGSPVALRLGTIGRPSSCVLGRAGNIIVLAQRQDEPLFGVEEWASAMQVTDICYNNYLGNLQNTGPVPKGCWTTLPEPEVRELVPALKTNSWCSATVSSPRPSQQTRFAVKSSPRPRQWPLPVEEEVEKYRCWEFMLEQNHKLLFTKELETLHKTIVLTGEPPTTPTNADPGSWYTTALSKYKCPLPSHRGRYYCYGNKTE